LCPLKCILPVARTVTRKFSIGGLCSSAEGLFVCAGGLDIIKLTKTPLIYSVSRFNLGEIGALFGGDKPTKAPPWRRDCPLPLQTLKPGYEPGVRTNCHVTLNCLLRSRFAKIVKSLLDKILFLSMYVKICKVSVDV